MTKAGGVGRDQLEALLNLMPTPAALVDAESERVVFANDASRDYVGNGRVPLEAAALAARGERVRGMEMTTDTADGARSLIVDAELVEAGAAIVLVSFRDVTQLRSRGAQAERAARRQRFLARASVVLDESLDPDVTLARVATLAVEGIADWCSVDVVDPDGSLRHVVTAHSDPDQAEIAQTLRERFPPDKEARFGAPNVVRTGRSELYPELTEEMLSRAARDPEQLAAGMTLGIRSAMIVPMRTRGKVVGAISFITTDPERRFDEDDLSLAEDLARRAAVSVETSRLYTERASIARTLQESLLPPALPEIGGFDVAARYTAAGEGNEVGGDFYDVFEIAPARWAVVIGDVCGKGADAASLTALVRYTIRALATGERPPSEVLELVNGAIIRQRGDQRFCTVALAELALRDGGGARVTFSNGGHPLPLVIRANGTAEPFGLPGTLLGVVPDPDLSDETIDIAPGDTLVLYTDGVTEARAPDVLLEPEDLARVAERCPAGPATETARCIEKSVREDEPGLAQDDIAILVLRAHTREDPGRVEGGAAARFSAD
jgi:serine phosphatase RsbU (regulator of sigma subunit)